MSSDPPPPYPGGPNAPLLEEKNRQPPVNSANVPIMTGPPQGHPLPPDYGPPSYEDALQSGFVPPHVPGESAAPKPMAGPMPMPHPYGGYYPPPGHLPHLMAEHHDPGPSHLAPGHTATVLSPPGAATTVTVLEGEMFQSAPVQTMCPHCQQPIITRISHDIGLMNTLFCLFFFFIGCDLGCCLIPCLFDDLKDVTHTCPNCKGYIYTYKRIC